MTLETANRLQPNLKKHLEPYKSDPILNMTQDLLDAPGILLIISNFGSHQMEHAMSMGTTDAFV